MSRRRVLVAAGVLGACVLAVGIVSYLHTKKDPSNEGEIYTIAPEFSLPDIHGNPLTLSEVDTPVRIVNFFASWSPYSADELRMLAHLQETYPKDVTVIALDRDTNLNDGRAFIAPLALEDTITFVFDQNDAYFKQVQGFAVPETVVLDEEGHIRAHIHGPATYEALDVHVKDILAE